MGEPVIRFAVWTAIVVASVLAIALVIVPYVIIPVKHAVDYYYKFDEFDLFNKEITTGLADLKKRTDHLGEKINECEKGRSCDVEALREEHRKIKIKSEQYKEKSTGFSKLGEELKDFLKYALVVNFLFGLLATVFGIVMIWNRIGSWVKSRSGKG